MAVCGRLAVSGFQLFRRRYSKKKIAGWLGVEAAPCTDRGTGDHTFSSSVRRPPRDTVQKGSLEVRQEGGTEPSRRAEAWRPREALGRSPVATLCGPSRWKVWGHCSLPHVVESFSGKEMADRVKPFRRTLPGESKMHLGNLYPLKAGCSNSAKEKSGFGEGQEVSWLREEPRARQEAGG